MSTVIGIIIGLVTGVLASMLFWWWQAKLLQPKVTICPTIARYEVLSGRPQCEFKIVNKGRRPAADLLITVRFVVPGLTSLGVNQVFKLREESLPWLEKGEDQYFFISPSHLTASAKKSYVNLFPKRIADAFEAGTEERIGMWELLAACQDATINVYVAASDSFSGARAFSKRTFQLFDFRDGAFLEDTTCGHTERYREVQAHQQGSTP